MSRNKGIKKKIKKKVKKKIKKKIKKKYPGVAGRWSSLIMRPFCLYILRNDLANMIVRAWENMIVKAWENINSISIGKYDCKGLRKYIFYLYLSQSKSSLDPSIHIYIDTGWGFLFSNIGFQDWPGQGFWLFYSIFIFDFLKVIFVNIIIVLFISRIISWQFWL